MHSAELHNSNLVSKLKQAVRKLLGLLLTVCIIISQYLICALIEE